MNRVTIPADLRPYRERREGTDLATPLEARIEALENAVLLIGKYDRWEGVEDALERIRTARGD